MRNVKIDVPHPSSEQVEHYLHAWDELENYHLQEDALDKLFFMLCPENTDMSDILLKVTALNDFYSTNIFSVYPVAKEDREMMININQNYSQFYRGTEQIKSYGATDSKKDTLVEV